jgi:hypothetical protein
MKTYTVQCGDARYYANTVVVEAENLEEALEKAIEQANDDPHWKSLDHCSPTFIDAVAEGADADPWDGCRSAIPIPDRFTEQGEPPTVTAVMEGGIVQDVTVAGGKVRVLVKDYDTEGAGPEHHDIRRDTDGDEYVLTDWTNEFPPCAADTERESA